MMSPFSRRLVLLAFFVSVALFVSSAFAGPGFLGLARPTAGPAPPGGTVGGAFDPSGGLPITAFKTPPLTAGQMISVPIEVHNPGPTLPNWAGVLVEVHLVDNTELDVAAVHLAPGNFPVGVWAGAATITSPFGGHSTNATSVPLIFPAMHPAAFSSGISLPTSGFHSAITLDLVAKNTNVTGNSDVDIRVRFADIYHAPDLPFTAVVTLPTAIHRVAGGSTLIPVQIPGSDTFQWQSSHRVLVTSLINDFQDLHLDAGGHLQNSDHPFPNAPPTIEFDSKYALPVNKAIPETGHFIHFPGGVWHYVTSTFNLHLIGGPGSTTIPGGIPVTLTGFIPGSTIFAVPFAATASIGIEHIPEPAAPILLLGGLASLVLGFRARRRRQQLA